MGGTHEQAWADALATEHTHQRELLATLRGELGQLARECAAALTALDDHVAALGGLGEAAEAAAAAHRHATAVLDVSRRLPELAPTTAPREDDAALYEAICGDGDVPPARAAELLRTAAARTDRELLRAVVDSAGVRKRLEELVGPAPAAALAALRPLARRLPALATIERDAGDTRRLEEALEASAALGAAVGEEVLADAAAVAGSLRDTVDHVRAAARAVEEGRLEQVLAEARRVLQADLDALGAVVDGAADAPADWLDARRAEHAALAEEVREKLERVERVRRALALILPHLRLATRALGTAEKARALAGRLDDDAAATLTAARLLVLLDLAALWEAIQPDVRSPAPQGAGRGGSRRRLVVALAAVAVAVAAAGIVVALTGGSDDTAAPTVTTTETPTTIVETPGSTSPAPVVSPVEAVFEDAARATFYSVAVRTSGDEPEYAWTLTPPADNATCDEFGPMPGRPERSVWYHADTDGCAHVGTQHEGTVTVTVTTDDWECTATFAGTLTATGPPAEGCRSLPVAS